MTSYKRADRVADLIKAEVADLLLKQDRDPRIGSVTITGVKVTDDLRTAKIFFVEMGKDTCSAEVRAGLTKATGFLRTWAVRGLISCMGVRASGESWQISAVHLLRAQYLPERQSFAATARWCA